MSKIIISAILMFYTVVNTLAQSAPNIYNALKPAGVLGEKLNLATAGKTSYIIVIPNSPTGQEKKSAELLAEYLKKMTGATFKIKKEPIQHENIISIGHTLLFEKNYPELAGKNLGDEGVGIFAKNKNLYLFGGKKRGPLYAVIGFLEEDLGCRWYSIDYEYIPKKESLNIKPAIRTFIPSFKLRDYYCIDAFNPTWSLMNRTSTVRFRLPEDWGGGFYPLNGSWFCHTFEKLVPKKEFGKTHPEFFSTVGKQLCLSNPDVLKISTDRVLKAIAQNPDSAFVSISQTDGEDWCECEECSKKVKKQASQMGTLLPFVNKIASVVEKKYPDLKVQTLAYLGTAVPPRNIKPNKNVMIWLCTDSHSWENPFKLIVETKKFQEYISGWNKTGAELFVWDYTANYKHYLIPYPNLRVINENINFYSAHGVKGLFIQGNHNGIGTSRGVMRAWVIAKKMWNPQLDIDALIEDFTFGYYGESGTFIQQYNQLLREQWKKYRHNPKFSKECFDRSFIVKAGNIIEKALSATKSSKIKDRINYLKINILYARLYLPIENKTDVKSYLTDLESFKELINKYKIKYYRENNSNFDIFYRSCIIKANKTKHSIFSNNSGFIECYSDEFELHQRPQNVASFIVNDSGSAVGFSAFQPGGNTVWSVQWRALPWEKIRPNSKYQLWIRARADKTGDGKTGMVCGIWSVKKKTYLAKQSIKASELDKEFKWFKIGEPVKLVKQDFVFCSPVKNISSIKATYIDCIRFVPDSKFQEL